MLGALPLIALIALAVWLWRVYRDWRTALLAAAVGWSLLLILFVESLSAFAAITPLGLSVAWSLVFLGALGGTAYQWRRTASTCESNASHTSPGRLVWAWCGCIALVALTIGVIAWIAPPNTWDSMTYHMARVAHWRQNRSVADYPTHCLRQLWLQPGAEYGVLNFQVLTGGDRLANFIQWLAMVGSVVGVSALARQLGARAPGQTLAAVFAATLPMGIVQGSSTQTDYVASFFLVCLAFFLLRLMGWDAASPPRCAGSPRWGDAFLAGVALGAGVLTKATDALFMLPLLALAAWALLRGRAPLALGQLALVLALAGAINLPFLTRNQQLFGAPLGPDSRDYRNATLGVRTTVSNMVRCAANQFAVPSAAAARRMTHAIAAGLGGLGINASDPATSYNASSFSVPDDPLNEDLAGNPLHLLLGALALPALLILPRLRRLGAARALSVCVITGTLLYCAVLRWQPWSNRLVLPLFVLGAAPAGTALAALWPRHLPHVLSAVLLLASLPWVVANRSRPMYSPSGRTIFNVPREMIYFSGTASAPRLFATLKGFAQAVRLRHCTSVGLISNENDGEYLLWDVIQAEVPWTVRIEHVDVHNASSALGSLPRFRDFNPRMTLTMTTAAPGAPTP